jgi:hypothetical protein
MNQVPFRGRDTPAVSLERALAAYTAWLDRYVGGSLGPDSGSQSGTDLLVVIATLRRTHYPHESHSMSELLIVHTLLTTLMFEHHLRRIRGAPVEALHKLPECVELVSRQLSAVEALRAACAAPITPIETLPSKAEPPIAGDGRVDDKPTDRA